MGETSDGETGRGVHTRRLLPGMHHIDDVTVGVGFYCLQDPSGCNPNVPPGASVPIDIVADVPTGFDAATMTYDIEARKSPIP